MKKFVVCLVACLGCLNLTVSAQKPSISVDDVYVKKGEFASFVLNLSNGREDLYSSLKFSGTFSTELPITLPETGAFSTNQTYWNGSTGDVNIPEPGYLLCSCAAVSNYVATSNVDNLVSIKFQIGEDAKTGEYPVTLSGITFAYNSSDKDFCDDVTFKIIVTDIITLDENSQVAPTELTTPSAIKVMRTIKANEWSTIVLPFDLTEAQVTEIFGEGTQLATFYDYSKATDAETGDVTIDVEFVDAEPEEGILFYAGTPYIIKVTKDITELNLSDMVIEYLELDDVESATKKSRKPIGKFIGTYVAKTVVPEGSLFLSNNKFNYSTGKTKMKAFRAYFTFNDLASAYSDAAAGARVNFFVKNGSGTTKIQIPELLNDGEYYDLNGLRVETPSKGIYIKDGKKVVVK